MRSLDFINFRHRLCEILEIQPGELFYEKRIILDYNASPSQFFEISNLVEEESGRCFESLASDLNFKFILTSEYDKLTVGDICAMLPLTDISEYLHFIYDLYLIKGYFVDPHYAHLEMATYNKNLPDFFHRIQRDTAEIELYFDLNGIYS